MGDLLRIDLTTRIATEETVPPELIRELHRREGHRHALPLEEVGPEVDPLGPQAKIIFSPVRSAGTTMFGGNRYAVYFASPLTSGYCECYSGGDVTPQFAKTGYKVVIVEGAADRPVYLEMSQRGAVPRRRRPLGTRHVRGRGARWWRRPAAEGAGLRHRPGGREPRAVRLHREQQVAQPRPRRPRRGDRQQEAQGHRLPRRQAVQVARPDEFKALVRDMAARGKDDPGVAAYRAAAP